MKERERVIRKSKMMSKRKVSKRKEMMKIWKMPKKTQKMIKF
jgi:hypothetical protein